MTCTFLSGRPRIAGLAVVLLCAAGCAGGSAPKESTGSDGDSAQAANVNNCALVTDAEAGSLGGRELKHDEDSFLGCPYVNVTRGSVKGELTVLAFRGKGSAKDQLADHAPDATVQDIAGVGDSAAALVRDGHVNFIVVQKGNWYVKFVTTFISDMEPGSPKLKEATDLALKALDRIR